MAILTSSQLTFVDITDQRQLSAYLTSNRTTVQIYDTDASSYNPDWSSMNLVVTPQVFLDQSNVQLSDANLTVTWKRKDGNSTETNLTAGETVSNNVLTVNANKLGATASDMLTYICYVEYQDTETSQTVNITTQLSYTLIRTASDAKTCLITGPQVFKYDTTGALVGDQQITLTGSVQHVTISKWQYHNGTTYVDYPTTTDNTNIISATLNVKPTHEIFNSAGVAKIKLITSDNDVYDIVSITKIYDGQRGQEGQPGGAGADAYTIYLTNESHTFAGTTDAAVAGDTTTQVYAYKGTEEKTIQITKVNNVNATTVQTDTGISGLQFKVSSISTVAHPTVTFYVLNTLTAQSGTVPITMTVDGTTFTKNFSWSVARTGSGACSLNITASSQIFKSSDGQTFTPDTITLTPIVQNLTLNNCTWAYSINGGSTYTNITATSGDAAYVNSTTKVLTIPKAWSAFTDIVTSIVLKCTNGDFYDTMTVSRLSDGKAAAAAYTVILSNEVQNIPTTTDLKPLSNSTYTCNVVVYEGTTQLTATNETPDDGTFKITLPSNPVGITLAQTVPGEVTFAVSASTAINASGNIDLSINIKGETTVTKSISYAVSKTGSAGTSPVVFTVYTPDGTVFANQTGSLTLATSAYEGATSITAGATYKWEKVGSADTVGTGSTLTVNGSSVANIATYRCTMTYNGKNYIDVITLEDKSDPYLSEMLTIGGTTFKNGQGGSFVYVIVRSNGKEVDPLLGPIKTTTLSTNTTTGYYYYADLDTHACTLYKWNGSAWGSASASDKQSLTYTWMLMDKDGNENSSFNKTGKIIYLSCDDINSIGTLQCDVENT